MPDQTTRSSHRVVADGTRFNVRNQDFGVFVGTYPSRAKAIGRARSLNVDESKAFDALVASIGTPLGRWGGILATEDEWTGDDRKFESDALRWDTNVPAGMPLRWTPTDQGGHNGAHHVGWIDRVARLEGGKIAGSGPYFDPEFGEFLKRAGKTGVSVDLDDETYDVQIPDDALDEQPQPGGTYPAIAEKKIFTDGRIRGVTAVSIPAFATGYIEIVDPVEVTDDQGERVETVDPATGQAILAAETFRRTGGRQGSTPGRDADSDGVVDEHAKRDRGKRGILRRNSKGKSVTKKSKYDGSREGTPVTPLEAPEEPSEPDAPEEPAAPAPAEPEAFDTGEQAWADASSGAASRQETFDYFREQNDGFQATRDQALEDFRARNFTPGMAYQQYQFSYGANAMNTTLRTGDPGENNRELGSDVNQAIENMDSFFEQNAITTPRDLTVSRVVSIGGDWDPSEVYTEGSIVPEAAYMSTTADENLNFTTSGPNGRVNMDIVVPKGTRFLPGHTEEGEMILPRGGYLKVLYKDPVTGNFKMEYVPPDER